MEGEIIKNEILTQINKLPESLPLDLNTLTRIRNLLEGISENYKKKICSTSMKNPELIEKYNGYKQEVKELLTNKTEGYTYVEDNFESNSIKDLIEGITKDRLASRRCKHCIVCANTGIR